MSPAAGPALPSDRAPVMVPAMISPAAAEMAAKDAIMTWYRGEFAAANAIIDALCNHITQLSAGAGGGASEYEAVFAAIHRRRLNWIPVIQMQKYYSIAEVALELRKVAEAKKISEMETEATKVRKSDEVTAKDEKIEVLRKEEEVGCNGNGGFSESVDEDSPDSEITDTGSQEAQPALEQSEICDNHEDCEPRREQIKMTKGFVAKEPVKGHMVNVVKGLKMFEDIFTGGEVSRLKDFVDELRVAGQNGELPGETYILFNKQVKGSKREQVQLGVPIFGHIKDEAASEKLKSNVEPIPTLIQSVIDHLAQWHIIPESRKPNGCIINYFDEGEYSHPYLKPPHLDQPICVLLLSESTFAFGRTLVNDGEGNFKGHLMLPIREGSVLVMRNNSADMARHVMCPAPTKRVSITFYRIRPDTHHNYIHKPASTLPPLTQAMTLWQPGVPSPCSVIPNGYEPSMKLVPMMTLAAAPPMSPFRVNPRKVARGGTGVFLPWGAKPRKPAKHLPPRALKNRVDAHKFETMSDPGTDRRSA